MITLNQPPFWSYPYGNETNRLQESEFYLSFEDALWALQSDLMDASRPKILLPDFYCMEVAGNMRARGFEPVFYRIGSDLKHDETHLRQMVQSERPGWIVVFHILGILPELSEETQDLIHSSGAIVIEDCAHSLLASSEVTLKSRRHFFIDSLRKVTPFQGARIFSHPDYRPPAPSYNVAGRGRIVLKYMLWRAMQTVASHWTGLSRTLGGSGNEIVWKKSEALFEDFNCAIGTSREPLAGFTHDRRLAAKISCADLRRIKEDQSRRLASFSRELSATGWTLPLAIPEGALGRLKFFPLALEKGKTGQLVARLEKEKVYLDCLYADSPHCRTRDYLMLPLGPHLREADLDFLQTTIRAALEELN